jgi:hypothetical protein
MAITFEAKLPRNLPKSVTVYRLDPPGVSTVQLAKTARRFGLKGDGKDFITAQDSLAYVEGRWQLEIQRASGALRYAHLDRYGVETEKAFELPDRRAESVASRFLETAALFPKGSARLRRITHMRGANANLATKRITEKVLDAGVVYGRIVDDLPVDGPGGFAMVNIDPEATVVGMRCVWRPLGARLAQVKIKSPEGALEALRKLTSEFKGDTTVIKSTFGYFELGASDKQTVLEPAYAFVFVVRDGEVAMKSAYVVHAGERTYGRLMGKKRFAAVEAQKPRKRDATRRA